MVRLVRQDGLSSIDADMAEVGDVTKDVAGATEPKGREQQGAGLPQDFWPPHDVFTISLERL
ncbi:hypothetical protein Sjap_005600 [Stephania japonica]|uniref:Uncharacterized protein n=1 Tax=Stephania japonica TaxID=461633 RepID=A0AAP0K6R7_9MAGN